MGVVRVTAMAPGSVEYLLHGCDAKPAQDTVQELDSPAAEPGEGLAAGARPGARAASQGAGAAGYLQAATEAGEPDGMWLGRGMAGLGLSMRAGDTADADDVRALFGQLRYPTSQMPESTEKTPVYLGSKPRKFRTAAQLVEDALKKEPTPVTAERHQQIEQTAKRDTRRPTAYYDVTFSPVKSVSLTYAALLSEGDVQGANAIRDAHDEAIRIAIASVEDDLAYVRTGRHEGHGPSGRTVGRWERASGLMVVTYAHHTNRDGEPQLHTHAAVSARAATPDGRIYAIDGYGFHAIKDALATAYTRAYQQLTHERLGFVYEQRADGVREIAGFSADLLAEGSTRTTEHVRPMVAELVEAYVKRHGHEPGPQARRALIQQAVKDTRQPKTGQAGPGAVAAWTGAEPGRPDRLAAALDAADTAGAGAVLDGTAPAPIAQAGARAVSGREAALAVLADVDAARAARAAPAEVAAQAGVTAQVEVVEVAEVAIKRGILDVQSKYATWNVGNLVRAIDEHLGDHAGALGVPAAERPAFLATIAQHVLREPQRFGIVQVSAGDPVPVPDMLRRTGAGEDGRPKMRAHIDERYATTAHLSAEQRLLAGLHTTGAPRAGAEQMAAVREQLAGSALSEDQAAAVCGVLSSGRSAEVIVGPAGTGKSHTMAVLAMQWTAVTGGRVHGVATAQIAARNLAGIGLDARNIRVFLRDFTPDPDTGLVRDRLGPHDLIVVDEAGMTPTTDLVAIANLAAEAGAKVVYVGDHHQLQPVGAGGMFAHLAGQAEVFELATVHRFAEPWEADASLLLRDGDPAAAVEYGDRGRLVGGTLDEITAMAVRGHVADMLDGKTALLIVPSNQLAADLSRQVRRELVLRGRVAAEALTWLPDRTPIGVGDLIQTRLNDYRLPVAASPDGLAMPVTNKELYTVVGRLGDGTLLARDARGAVAHLPDWYVREHVTLAYAVTGHAAQGVTVDVGRGVLPLDATREQAYVPASRGRERNLLYLQTEHQPDSHEPQRIEETPIQRFADILSRDGVDESALTALETARADEASMATLGGLYAVVSKQYSHAHNAQMLTEILGPERAALLHHDEALGALLGALYAAELDGHDPRALLTEAIAMRELDSADSIARTLHWRVGVRVTDRDPEHRPVDAVGGAVDRGRHWNATAYALPEGHPVREYLLDVGELIEHRRDELGAQIAADPPAWAQQRLPAVPDPATAPDARMAWERRAGVAGAYREYRGIPDTQVSLGEAPPPAQQFARAMWLDAVEQLDEDPVTRHWSRATDAQLLQARETWQRTVRDADEHGPRSVAEEMSGSYRLGADIRADAILLRAEADLLPDTDPAKAEMIERAERYRELSERYVSDARALETDHTARQQWWGQVAPLREADQAAGVELHRRSLANPDPQQPDPQRPDARAAGPEQSATDHGGSSADGRTPDPGRPGPGTNGDRAGADQPPVPAPAATVAEPGSRSLDGIGPDVAADTEPARRGTGSGPNAQASDAVHTLDEVNRQSRLSRARRDGVRAAQPGPDRPEQSRQDARAAADQRDVEAARRAQRTDTPAHGTGAQRSGMDQGHDDTTGAGYDWD